MKYIIFIILFVLLSAQLLPCRAEDRTDCKLVITNEKNTDGKKIVNAVFIMKADPDRVYHTLRDVEKFTEFMPGSAKVEILERDEKYQVVKFSGSRGLLSGDIVMKRNIDDANRRIDWNLVDGPPREVCGYWYVEKDSKDESVSIVHYSNYVDAGVIIPDFLVRKYLYEDIKKWCPILLNAWKVAVHGSLMTIKGIVKKDIIK